MTFWFPLIQVLNERTHELNEQAVVEHYKFVCLYVDSYWINLRFLFLMVLSILIVTQYFALDILQFNF